MMSKALNLKLKDDQAERLDRMAAALGQTRTEMAARLLEEALRMEAFPLIDFRTTVCGREAFLTGTRIKA